jgi:dUTP pyrophosphatase
MEKIPFKVKRIHKDAKLPEYAHHGDAGMDLFAVESHVINPSETKLIPTGIQVEFPLGYELQIRPRSGLALKKGISIVNTPGTVDAGYRGEIGIIMINHGKEIFEIQPGDKIAQAVLNKIEFAQIEEAQELADSERKQGGFGSTGMKKI